MWHSRCSQSPRLLQEQRSVLISQGFFFERKVPLASHPGNKITQVKGSSGIWGKGASPNPNSPPSLFQHPIHFRDLIRPISLLPIFLFKSLIEFGGECIEGQDSKKLEDCKGKGVCKEHCVHMSVYNYEEPASQNGIGVLNAKWGPRRRRPNRNLVTWGKSVGYRDQCHRLVAPQKG